MAKANETFVLQSLSPKGQTMGVYHRSKEGSETIFASTSGKILEEQALKGYFLSQFLSETRIVAVQKMNSEAPDGLKHRVVAIDLDGKNEKVIHQSKDRFWDDVPMQLSPDKKYLTYFTRENKKGLVVVNLKTGKQIPVLEHGTFSTWNPGSNSLGVFHTIYESMENIIVCLPIVM